MIADPSYITLNDNELGTRTYHDQHFFCSECGDPFVTPNMMGRTFEGDGMFEGGEVGAGFTVFRGFPYCANCHAKLRWPRCKKCRKSMAPDSDIIEALGAKWCSDCFVCTVSFWITYSGLSRLFNIVFRAATRRSGMGGSSYETINPFAKTVSKL